MARRLQISRRKPPSQDYSPSSFRESASELPPPLSPPCFPPPRSLHLDSIRNYRSENALPSSFFPPPLLIPLQNGGGEARFPLKDKLTRFSILYLPPPPSFRLLGDPCRKREKREGNEMTHGKGRGKICVSWKKELRVRLHVYVFPCITCLQRRNAHHSLITRFSFTFLLRDLVDIVRRAFKLSGLPNPLMNVPSLSRAPPVASITGIEEEGNGNSGARS